MHVERWRIDGADPFKSSLAAPEFHAALEVRVEDPHAILSPRLLDGAGFSRVYMVTSGEYKGEAWEEGESDRAAQSRFN